MLLFNNFSIGVFMKELNKNLENIFDNLALKNFYDNNQKNLLIAFML